MSTKTYIVKVKHLETNHKDIAVVHSGNKEAAITKFILHMHTFGVEKTFNSFNHTFEYDEKEKCYYNIDKTLRMKIKHINLNNDFILI